MRVVDCPLSQKHYTQIVNEHYITSKYEYKNGECGRLGKTVTFYDLENCFTCSDVCDRALSLASILTQGIFSDNISYISEKTDR
jgi:hypothetical protein